MIQRARWPLLRFRARPRAQASSDAELVALFARDGERAWDQFLDRYAEVLLSHLRHLGFDHDEAMDRFVFVCEKLSEDGFRRLRQVEVPEEGGLAPWLRTVVRNLSVSWAWSIDGRRRLFRSIAALPERAQRVFSLYFWQGLRPSEVRERLQAERQEAVALVDVLDDLDAIFRNLDEDQRWRLMSQLQRSRRAVAIGVEEEDEDGPVVDPAEPGDDPEAALLRDERRTSVERETAQLPARDRLILQLRYEESLGLGEVAEVVGVSVSTVKGSLRASRERLAAALAPWKVAR